jgi:N-acyl homoserine lactone hydrolase
MRQVNILLDRSWTEALPIYAWAVETPEGVVVVDTGETARTGERGYFPRWHRYFRLAVQLDVTPEQEVAPQLLKLGIRPDDVQTVILTHLHTDHAGGLHHFLKSKILVSDEELAIAKGFAGRLRGYLPNRWPQWFAPRSIVFESKALAPFDRSHHVTSDGTVVIVPTPGHTPGHVSVVVVDGDVNYFLAGDTTYTQQALVDEQVDGVSVAARLHVTIQPFGGKGMSFRPTVLVADLNRELRWLGHLWLPGLFDGEHLFRFEALSEVRVRFVQRERFKGLLVPFLSKMLDADIQLGFEQMNQALKLRCE